MRAGEGDKRADGSKAYRYVCGAPMGACPAKVSIAADRTEEYVAAQFLGVFGSFEVVEMRESSRDTGELAEVEQAIQQTAALMGAPDADFAALVDRMTMLRARRELLEAIPVETIVEQVNTGESFAEAWDARDVHGRRALLASALLGPIVVRPMLTKSKIIDWDRLDIPWRWSEPDVEAELADAARND
jgi:hypothetical protein